VTTVSEHGSISAGEIGTGDIADNVPIGLGIGGPQEYDGDPSDNYASVGAFATTTTLFTNLMYTAGSFPGGSVTLSPTVDTAGTDLWAVEFPGDLAGDDPEFVMQTYGEDPYTTAPISLTLVEAVPEPASLSLLLAGAAGLLLRRRPRGLSLQPRNRFGSDDGVTGATTIARRAGQPALCDVPTDPAG